MSKKKKAVKDNLKMAYMKKKAIIASIVANKKPKSKIKITKNVTDNSGSEKMSYGPKISVIIPVYNVESYLAQCLDSVIGQTLKEIEILCIDDGSTDNSLEILKEYAQKDKRVKIFTQKNSGSGKARNLGIKSAKGEFIAFMDSDDLYPSEKTLEHMYSAAVKNNVLICGGSLSQLRENNKIVTNPKEFEKGYSFSSEGIIKYSDYQFDYGYWRFIYNRQFLQENQIYFPDYLRQQDPPFFVKAMAIGRQFYALKEPTYVYRVSYKKIQWNERKAIDVVRALMDILEYTKIYNLEKLHCLIAKRLVNPWFLQAFKLLIEKEENKLLLEKLVATLDYKVIYKWDSCFSLTLFYKALPNLCKISIIIPVYNVEPYLSQCLDSVVNQTYQNIEIICVNDGSTDGSLKLLEQYAKQDKRIIIITQNNQGLPNARNTGLLRCSGNCIMFLDSDDWLDLNYVETMYKKMLENDADVVKSGYKHYISDTEIKDDSINKIIEQRCIKNENLKIWENNVVVWATLYKRSFLVGRDIFLFDRYILKHEDILYTLKVTTLANKIVPVSGVYYHYRRSSSVLSAFNSKVAKIYPTITKQAIDFLNNNLFIDKETYINNARRLVWRLLETYEKLNKIEDVSDKDLSSYVADIKEIFSQLEYKKEVFLPYRATLSKINSQELYNAPVPEPKKVLVIEINDCHGECLPGYIKYFQDLGYVVKVLINIEQQKESPLCMFNNVNITYASRDEIIRFLNSKALERYNVCLFNSNIIYGYNKTIFEVFNYKEIQTKFLCVEHRLENIPILSQKAICIVLKKFRKTKLAYEVNPHYFGNIIPHKKNEVVNFIVVGNIEGRRKNYNILMEAVKELNRQKIKNFKVTVVGKGNVLDIPKEIRSFFDVKGRLSYPDMYNEVQNADYFLPLLDPKNNEHERYITTGTSGSFQLIYGFKIPCLIANKFAKVHGFDDTNSILYNDNKELGKALMLAIKQTDADYKKIQDKLSEYTKALYQKSLSNLALALNAKIAKRWRCTPYLLFPYYLVKNSFLKEKLSNYYIRFITERLTEFRIDIRNYGCEENDVNIDAQDVIIKDITWNRERGQGKYLEGRALSNKVVINVVKDGILKLEFKGVDKRFDGECFPIWIDYKSIKVDGKEILSTPIATWHNKPYSYEMSVKDGQQIIIEVEQQYHEYTEKELKDILLKLNSNFGNGYIYNNIALIIEKLRKQLPILNEETRKKRILEQCVNEIMSLLISFRIDIRNYGCEENDVNIDAQDVIIKDITWNRERGQGKYLEGRALSNKVVINVVKDGILKLEFKGVDKRFDGECFPIWIDYKSIKVDGKEILSTPIATWHNKPYSYEMSVKDGQQIIVEVEQQYHEYTEKELKDTLSKLYCNDNQVCSQINEIITELRKTISVIDKRNYFNLKDNFFVIDSNNLDDVQEKLYGYVIQDNGIVEDENKEYIDKDKISGCGAYIYVAREKEKITISQDINGSYGLFLFKKDKYFALSNSFFYLIDYLKGKFSLEIDTNFVNYMLAMELCSESYDTTWIKNIKIIDKDDVVSINIHDSAISLERKERQISNYFVDTQDGIEILDRWFARWTKIFRNIKSNTNNIMISLSGGMDSRITFLLALKSGINLNDIRVHSIKSDLHTFREDYEIASQIAEYFDFELNKDNISRDAINYSFEDVVNICIYNKLPFHKELNSKQQRFIHKIYEILGAGGEALRSHWDFSTDEKTQNYLKYLESQVSSKLQKLSTSVRKIAEDSYEKISEKYNVDDIKSSEVLKYLYMDTRCRNHFGKISVEDYFCGHYLLTPLLDPELLKLRTNTQNCSDNNLLISVIFTRYCPDLLKFKIEGGRKFNEDTIAVAKMINDKYPVDMNKLLSENIVGEYHISTEDKNIRNIISNLNKGISQEQLNKFFENSFNSKYFENIVTKYIDDDIYLNIQKNYKKRTYYPLRDTYPLFCLACICDSTRAKNKIENSNYEFLEKCYNNYEKFGRDFISDVTKKSISAPQNRIVDNLIDFISTYRIDIKNIGTDKNSMQISCDNGNVEEPKWFSDEQGIGKMVQGNSMRNTIRIKAINDGMLKIYFRGQDKRDANGARFPVWIDYKSIKIDGKEILSALVITWHDKPYHYEMPVKDGQEIILEIEQQYHEYTEDELKDILEKLNVGISESIEFLKYYKNAIGFKEIKYTWNYVRDNILTQNPQNIKIDNLKEETSGRLQIRVENTNFESVLIPSKTKKLYVFLSAVGNKNCPYPTFHRISWCEDYDGLCLYMDDPTRHEFDFAPAYYFGSKENNYLEYLLKIINQVAMIHQIKEENVTFISSSNGGFASLWLCDQIKKSRCFVYCPQIDIQTYRNSYFLNGQDMRKVAMDRTNLQHVTKNSKSHFFIYSNINCNDDKQQMKLWFRYYNKELNLGFIKLSKNVEMLIVDIEGVIPHEIQPLKEFTKFLINEYCGNPNDEKLQKYINELKENAAQKLKNSQPKELKP